MTRDARQEPLIPIDHARIVDSQAQLVGFPNYVPFDTYCGICDSKCHVTPRTQKYILEVRRVPVSALRQGAVFCESCRARRARIQALRRNDRWRTVEDGASELSRLEAEEAVARQNSKAQYTVGNWPYGHAV